MKNNEKSISTRINFDNRPTIVSLCEWQAIQWSLYNRQCFILQECWLHIGMFSLRLWNYLTPSTRTLSSIYLSNNLPKLQLYTWSSVCILSRSLPPQFFCQRHLLSGFIVIRFHVIIMDQTSFILRRWWPHVSRGLGPIVMLPDGGFLVALHIRAIFNFDYLGKCSHWRNRGMVA